MSTAIIAALAFVAGVLAAGGALLVFAAWTTRDPNDVEPALPGRWGSSRYKAGRRAFRIGRPRKCRAQ
jgi:hypothetical protein